MQVFSEIAAWFLIVFGSAAFLAWVVVMVWVWRDTNRHLKEKRDASEV